MRKVEDEEIEIFWRDLSSIEIEDQEIEIFSLVEIEDLRVDAKKGVLFTGLGNRVDWVAIIILTHGCSAVELSKPSSYYMNEKWAILTLMGSLINIATEAQLIVCRLG
ncbi:hypothetical protein GQ457_02G033980 [Hibiscus cannabinus]